MMTQDVSTIRTCCCICMQAMERKSCRRSAVCAACKKLPVIFLCDGCAKRPSVAYMCRHRWVFRHCDPAVPMISMRFCRGCERFQQANQFCTKRKRCLNCQRKHQRATKHTAWSPEEDFKCAERNGLSELTPLALNGNRRTYLARTTLHQQVVVKFVADCSYEVRMLQLVEGSPNVITCAGTVGNQAILFEHFTHKKFSVCMFSI